ncbi:hypothetical protein LQ51_30465 [Micromonospora sp. HK10]|nr:hypothetical protein LQ51_30465 [Micromonospora sp. HK10]
MIMTVPATDPAVPDPGAAAAASGRSILDLVPPPHPTSDRPLPLTGSTSDRPLSPASSAPAGPLSLAGSGAARPLSLTGLAHGPPGAAVRFGGGPARSGPARRTRALCPDRRVTGWS